MIIQRQKYLNKIISKKGNGLVKIITGIKHCGKSFLLFKLYHDYLNSQGVTDDCIIKIALDEEINAKFRNPMNLSKYIRELTSDKSKMFYVFIDEIQIVYDIQNPYLKDKSETVGFEDVLLGLMKLKNVDLYVIGSSANRISKDILTQFRGRGDEVKVSPLSYREFYDAYSDTKAECFKEYCTYGGLPVVASKVSHDEKKRYLRGLIAKDYILDIMKKNNIKNGDNMFDELLKFIAVTSTLTNPKKISDFLLKSKNIKIHSATITKYIDYIEKIFLISKVRRYDIKRKTYKETPLKYYYNDIGLRNAKLNFRQAEENHLMENIIYNELLNRGFDVDIGSIEYYRRNEDGSRTHSQYEINFVANHGSNRYYIQSALSIADENERQRIIKPLKKVADSFKKIVVVKDNTIPWHDDDGIFYIGIEKFLLDENAINL